MALDDLSLEFNIKPQQTTVSDKQSKQVENSGVDNRISEQLSGAGSEPSVEKQEQKPSVQTKYDNSAAQNGTAELNSEEQIREQFIGIFKKYNCEYDFNTILIVSGRLSKKELLERISKEEIEKIQECLQKAFEKHYDKKTKELDLNAAVDTAQKYSIAKSTGWTIEKFEEAQKSQNPERPRTLKGAITLTYKMENKNKEPDFDHMSKEELKNYVRKYFDNKFEYYKQQTKNNPKDATVLLIKDFGLILANTSDEDKALLMPVVTEVINDIKPLKILLQSFKDPAKAIKFADSLDPEQLRKLNREQLIEFVKYMSKDGIEKTFHSLSEEVKEFYFNNKEKIDTILDKIKNGEELTEEEQKIKAELDRLTNMQANVTVGAADNKNIDEEQKQELLGEMNDFAKQYPTYRQYLESIANYVNDPNSDLSIAIEEFNNLMNAATNGNYSTVVKDLQNGTTTPLNMENPSETGANNPDGVGYATPASSTNQSLADCQNNVKILQTQVAGQSDDRKVNNLPTQVHESKRETSGIPAGILTVNNIATYLEENNLSLKNFVIDVLTGSNKVFKDMNMRKYAANVYKTMMGKYEQIYCLENSKGGNIIALLIDNSKEGVLEKFGQGGKVAAGGFDITKMIAAAAKKEDEEEEKHQNAAVC